MRAKQQTALTPRLQQSVKLLQMSTLDFSREVAEAIANNPFLEEEEGAPGNEARDEMDGTHQYESQPELETAADLAARATASDTDPDHGEMDAVTTTSEYDASQEPAGSYSGDYPTSRNNDQPETDIGQWARSETSLQDALRKDLCSYQLNPRDRLLVELIIEALDNDGYLREPMDELLEPGQLEPMPADSEWDMALKLVQNLGAPGIGARDLQECLVLQLKDLSEDTEGRELALRIVQDALDRLGRCDYAGLARTLGVEEADVHQACLLIRSLEPRPGARYTSVDPSCYVVPDVYVRKIGDLWVALPNDSSTP